MTIALWMTFRYGADFWHEVPLADLRALDAIRLPGAGSYMTANHAYLIESDFKPVQLRALGRGWHVQVKMTICLPDLHVRRLRRYDAKLAASGFQPGMFFEMRTTGELVVVSYRSREMVYVLTSEEIENRQAPTAYSEHNAPLLMDLADLGRLGEHAEDGWRQ